MAEKVLTDSEYKLSNYENKEQDICGVFLYIQAKTWSYHEV